MPEGSAERQSRLDFRALWRNVSWTSISVAVTTLLAFAETILLVRVLGATLLGIFILVRIYPEVVQQVLDCRTRETIVRYLGEFVALNQRERACALVRLVWMVDAAAGLAGMAVVLVTASLAARYIVHDTALVWPMALYAVAQFAETLDSASGPVLRVFDRFKLASMVGVGKCFVRFAVILAVLLSGGGIVPLIYALVAVEITYLVASSCISISLLRRSIGFRVRGTIEAVRDRRREILKFLLQTNVASTLKMGSDKLIVIIVGVLGGPAVTAYYKVAAQVGASVMLFSDPFYVVVYPWLSGRAARKEWNGMYADMRRLHRLTLAIALPLALVASGLMIPLIPAVFGKELSAAVVPAIIIFWGILPDAVYFWVGAVLACIDQVGRLVRYRAIASSLQLVVALVLIPFIGVIGAAVSVLVMHWLYTGLRLRLNESCRRRLIGEEVMP